MKKTLVIFFWTFLTLTSCGPRSGINTESSVSEESIGRSDTSGLSEKLNEFNLGRDIFKTNCARCHRGPEDRGTDLYDYAGLFDRLPKPPEEYFIKYLKDTKALKDSGDPRAIRLDKQYNSDYDHYFKDSIKDQDFQRLILYIKVSSRLK